MKDETGKKDSLEQDIAKAEQYKIIFETKRHLCIDAEKRNIK